MKNFSVRRLHYVGTDMISYFLSDAINKMDEKTFDLYMKYHYQMCEREDCVGLSSHILDVFSKETDNL